MPAEPQNSTSAFAVPMSLAVGISGTGHALGSEVITNDWLAPRLGVTSEWIESRAGIRERRRAAANEFTSTLGARAAASALTVANLKAADLDAIICATVTPDYSQMPSTACLIQALLGTRNIPAFDLSGACSGFVYALEVSQKLVASGMYRHVLVIGADLMTRFTDYEDPKTSILFADGAGAAIVSALPGARGILATHLASDGGLSECLVTPAGGSRLPASCETVRQRLHVMKMRGRELFKTAVTRMSESANSVLSQLGLTPNEIDLVVPHQANQRIIDAVGARIGIEPGRMFSNIEFIGNSGAASIPIALDQCVRIGRLAEGDLVLLTAFGGGITWGSAVVRW